MSNKQTTAVQNIIKKIDELLMLQFDDSDEPKILELIKKDCIDQLPIERKQIEDAYNQGYREAEEDLTTQNKTDISEYENAEKYFTSTFITE